MADAVFDEETNVFLSQVDIEPVDANWFDIETDFVLSQFNLDNVLDMDVKSGLIDRTSNFPYSQTIGDVNVEANKTETSNCNGKRFNFEAKSSDVKKLQAFSTPLNTQRNTRWGVNTLDDWGKWRNDRTIATGLKESAPYVLVPPLTVGIGAAELCHWMCRFILEVRRQDGSEYPAESLRQLCISIWRYLRDTCRRYDLNFFDSLTLSTYANALTPG
ncbi:uncharacterized protein LOC128552672 [Mercenaria mercenaria]|uniref:uncharacterized protein LOC128552672 n=1 Tax=Mercenaria mercenaria TaxID=6596 RepID=UPI00234F3287|nr:uncharacterized protein LOC128552672 [Mercenaria mercenaria]